MKNVILLAALLVGAMGLNSWRVNHKQAQAVKLEQKNQEIQVQVMNSVLKKCKEHVRMEEERNYFGMPLKAVFDCPLANISVTLEKKANVIVIQEHLKEKTLVSLINYDQDLVDELVKLSMGLDEGKEIMVKAHLNQEKIAQADKAKLMRLQTLLGQR